MTTPFTDWLFQIFAEKRGETNVSAIARALNVNPSSLTRPGRWPRPETLRAASQALGVPILTVLVAAGYLTEDESRIRATKPAPDRLTDDELLAEVRRRIEQSRDDSRATVTALPSRDSDSDSEELLAARTVDPDDPSTFTEE